MSQLLEILGRAITIDTADLIWHWFTVSEILNGADTNSAQVQQFDKIIELMGNKKIDAAEEQLKLYLFDNPSCLFGRLAVAAIFIQKSRIAKAIEELKFVYHKQPVNTMALYALGHCYERIGKEAKAIEFYQDCLKYKGHLQLPRQRLAAIYFKNGQLEKTIEQYQLYIKEYPEDVPAFVTLGHLYIATQRFSEATEAFNRAILTHPDNFYSDDDRLDQLLRKGQLDEALEQLDMMLQEQSENVGLIFKQADVLAMLGATNESICCYEKAIQLCPTFLAATIKLGTQYMIINQPWLAALKFNRAIEINDQIVDAYVGLAVAQKLDNKLSDAVATLSLAAAIQPNSSLLFAETATLQFQAGLNENISDTLARPIDIFDAVIDAHREQIRTSPQNPDVQYRLGVLMMSVNRINDAAKAFKTALDINPTFNRAGTKLAMCLFEAGKKKQAMQQLTEPVCPDKDTLELHYKTALLYCDKIKFASSLINLESQMEKNFTSAEATVNISLVLQNLGLLDREIAMWDNLADTASQAINSNHPFYPPGSL